MVTLFISPPKLTAEETEHYRLLVEKTMKEMAEKADILIRKKPRERGKR